MLTFIPYDPADKPSRRLKELEVSRARSHAATRSHHHRRARRRDEHDEAKSQLHIDTKRLDDWHFGNVGGSCRFLVDIEGALLKHYLDHSVELVGSGGLLSGDQVSSVKSFAAPLARALVQQALTEMPLLDGFMAWITFLIAAKYSSSHVLLEAGCRYIQDTIRNLRSWISRTQIIQPAQVLFCVVFLCMATLDAGDLGAAHTHLLFLLRNSRALNPANPEHSRLFWAIRSSRLRYSLLSGKLVRASGGQASDFGAARPEETSPDSMLSGDHIDSTSTCPPFRNNGNHAMLSTYSNNPPTIDPQNQVSLSDCMTQGPHNGFHQAMTSNLLSLNTFSITKQFTTFMDRMYDSVQDPDTPLLDLLELMTHVHQCLDTTLTEWHALKQRQHGATKSDASHCNLDETILLAIQILLVSRSVNTLAPTLPILSSRLIASLADNCQDELGAEIKAAVCANDGIRKGLLLWVSIAGLLGSAPAALSASKSSSTQSFNWFWKQASDITEALEIEDETQLMATLAPFIPESMPPDDKFLATAKSLACKQKNGQTLNSDTHDGG